MRHEIDGLRFATLEQFYEEISRILIPGSYWGRNLDAFNDILRGGFGTPESGFDLIWRNHAVSQNRLGHEETIRQLEKRLLTCHSTNRAHVEAQLIQARAGAGPTVFDWIVEIIRDHGPGGDQAEDNVTLYLD